jgi:hypothetical protein
VDEEPRWVAGSLESMNKDDASVCIVEEEDEGTKTDDSPKRDEKNEDD